MAKATPTNKDDRIRIELELDHPDPDQTYDPRRESTDSPRSVPKQSN